MPLPSNSLSYTERHALGVRARKQLPRSAHAAFDPAACTDKPLDILFVAERGRVAKLLAIKHQRMAASPFGFFRGAVPIMAADLAAHPHSNIATQMCGDAHVLNLGAYAAADGRIVFDINDFDETLRGPFEWDVKRLATSLLLAGREAGIRRSARRAAVRMFTAQYRSFMQVFADMPVLELARYQTHRVPHAEAIDEILRTAEQATPQKSLLKLTEHAPGGGGARRFRSEPPLLERVPAKEARLVLDSLHPYAATLQPERRHFLDQYQPQDVAFKVVGTGSVGLRDYCIYCDGPRRDGASDPLLLQVKEESASAYAPYLPDAASAHTQQGLRVVDGQRAMQLTSDPFLGYTSIEGRDYLVRQLNDHKAGLDLANLSAVGLMGYADLCGELLARGHARAGDPVAIAAYLGKSDRFDRAIVAFALAYADKTEQDCDALRKFLKKKK